MTPPRRRAWLRLFGVRCSLPCDPPVGGHSCNEALYHDRRGGHMLLPPVGPPVSHCRRPVFIGVLGKFRLRSFELRPKDFAPPAGRASDTRRIRHLALIAIRAPPPDSDQRRRGSGCENGNPWAD